ncbi:MAG TPA: thioesterase family protein [Caulobacteraceae bacterium]
MTALNDSLALETLGPNLYRGHADPAYLGPSGMFGGWIAALMLKAVLDGPSAESSASALTVNFLNPVPAGSSLTLRRQSLGGSRSLAHWRCDLSVEGSDDLAVAATIVLAKRRDSQGFVESAMPEVPAPEGLETYHGSAGPFSEHNDQRRVAPDTPFNQNSTRSLTWQREDSGRPLDTVQLAYLCDIGAPRVYFISDGRRPSSTITLSLYIHATDAELRTCGDDFILSDTIGTRIEHSTVGEKSSLWSRSGKLLATSEQLCWFR